MRAAEFQTGHLCVPYAVPLQEPFTRDLRGQQVAPLLPLALQVLDQVGFIVLRQVVASHEALLALGTLKTLVTCQGSGEQELWSVPGCPVLAAAGEQAPGTPHSTEDLNVPHFNVPMKLPASYLEDDT